MDLEVRYGPIVDEPALDEFGRAAGINKRVTFKIGPHGPFIERIPAGDTWRDELARRVNALKLSLGTLPT